MFIINSLCLMGCFISVVIVGLQMCERKAISSDNFISIIILMVLFFLTINQIEMKARNTLQEAENTNKICNMSTGTITSAFINN
jgi:hypothetical protein